MFSDPVKNLKAFGLREDNVVADLGAGTGYYSLAAGALVPRGKVYAIEISKDFLHTIEKKVKDVHLNNVDIVWGNVEKLGGTKIGDGVLDDVIASNIFFQVEDKNQFILEIKRILKNKGRVLLIDWSGASFLQIRKTVSKEDARKMFEEHGFTFERDIDAGEHHYGMIFIKS